MIQEQIYKDILKECKNYEQRANEVAKKWISFVCSGSQPYGMRLEENGFRFHVGHYDGLKVSGNTVFLPSSFLFSDEGLYEHAVESKRKYDEKYQEFSEKLKNLKGVQSEINELENRIRSRSYEHPEGFPYSNQYYVGGGVSSGYHLG